MKRIGNEISTLEKNLSSQMELEDSPCVIPDSDEWGVRITRYGQSCLSLGEIPIPPKPTPEPQDNSDEYIDSMTPCFEIPKPISFWNDLCIKYYGNNYGLKELKDCNDLKKKRALCADGYINGIKNDFDEYTIPCEKLLNKEIWNNRCSNYFSNENKIGWKRVFRGKEGGCLNEKNEYDDAFGRLQCSPIYKSGYPIYQDYNGNYISTTTKCYNLNEMKKMDKECKRLYTNSSKLLKAENLDCNPGQYRGICQSLLL